jgi:hypothetical protein
MLSEESNRYRFQCEVVEVIYKDGKRIIKAMCNPGTMIIETPDDGKIQLGDRMVVTGTIHIEKSEPGSNTENIIPNQ